MKFLGHPYPVIRHPNGFLRTQFGVEQIKADLLSLLLTHPGERVFLPTFGTPLKTLIFDPNDQTLQDKARQMIIASIQTWEPRIAVQQIEVSNVVDESSLNPADALIDLEHILFIRIVFYDPDNIADVQELKLEMPLAGG